MMENIKRRCWEIGIALVMFLALGAPGVSAAPVLYNENGSSVTLSNAFVSLRFSLAQRTFSIADTPTNAVVLENCGFGANGWIGPKRQEKNLKVASCRCEDIEDSFGKGKRVVLELAGENSAVLPNYLFSYRLNEGGSEIVMNFGMKNNRDYDIRLCSSQPLTGAKLAQPMENPLTLNGAAGAARAFVAKGLTRESPNSLMLTGLVKGKRRTVVWGGLANKEFGKYAELKDGVLDMKADDPVGRLVDKGETYWSGDTFYLDIVTADPFEALEKYGRSMRAANNAKPNVYDFPVLCGWSVGALSKLPSINNSAKLVEELERAQKCGLTKYTKVGIRLEPDTYCYGSGGNTEQGWWDDEHWAKYGHLTRPYETFAKWCAAIKQRDGIPYTYFQVGMPSNDYARAFPGHMLSKDLGNLAVWHSHHQPQVTYDYTSQDFQKRTLAMWQRLRKDGIQGIKFDYPESGWRPEGGFENRHATTAFAYREAFRLCREGLGPDAFLDERNLGESGRPCLDVTAGIVDTQRNWGDSNAFQPEMVTICGLRWYKNRTVFNYFPDTKTVHDLDKGVRRGMLTMMFLTSGRLDLATSFQLFTPEIVQDFSRIYPSFREPFTARPVDAFTGVGNPQVYDLELTPEWHQVALFNTGKNTAMVSTALSGDRVVQGSLGLPHAASYYVYDFWEDRLVGKLNGPAKLECKLEPRNCAMFSVRKVQANPQVLSTNRHVLQGWLELKEVKWDAASGQLSGKADLIGGEPMRIVLAGNGRKTATANAEGAEAKISAHPAGGDFAVLSLARPNNGKVAWCVKFE